MRKQINSEQDFSYGYLRYVIMEILSNLCCCICRKFNWYQRNLEKLRKIKLARDKVDEELELLELIQNMRIFYFTHKTLLNRR